MLAGPIIAAVKDLDLGVEANTNSGTQLHTDKSSVDVAEDALQRTHHITHAFKLTTTQTVEGHIESSDKDENIAKEEKHHGSKKRRFGFCSCFGRGKVGK